MIPSSRKNILDQSTWFVVSMWLVLPLESRVNSICSESVRSPHDAYLKLSPP